jgi:L-threonylcarbamoyladenylate synthase
VIYDDPSGLAPNVVAADHTVAIRIVNNVFCQALISKFGKPIVSTSANFSNRPSPSGFDEIDPLLLKQADYIVNLPTVETKNPASRIIKLNELGEVEFLRK